MGIASTTQQPHHLTLDHVPTRHMGIASTTQQPHHLTLDQAPPDTWVLLVPHNNPITSHWTTPHQTHGYC